MTRTTNDLQLWGGPECSVNRIGNTFGDQLCLSGHQDRPDDLALFAALGISTIRYALLWERIAPHDPGECAWEWTDGRLALLRGLGIEVIGGLVHHGSGPRYTDLLDTGFATGLARFARQVAERYAWIEDWCPVNEPLTTARFSALYGHWHPHARDERLFWLALLNQIDGICLAMRAVRRVNPHARLIQTDDLGHTYATAALSDQAAFDNERRWAGWDLLCGRLRPDHPLWERLVGFGFEDRLRAIADDPCPPDVVGVNHYLTSDRFLDHRLDRYPGHLHGGNGRRPYADIEAVRAIDPPPDGFAHALRSAWLRYGIPLALTEVHNGCTREEQMRWTAQAWDTATALRAEGIAIEAVTSWALLGSHGWNTLLTGSGAYEPGAYDVSGGAPRATALAGLLQGLATNAVRHPVVAGAGWWQRAMRLAQPNTGPSAPSNDRRPSGRRAADDPLPPLLICGATGTLGRAFARACRQRDIAFVLTSRANLDLTDEAGIAAALDAHAPWAVINAAGWVRVDEAEQNIGGCFAANAEGPAALAAACLERAIPTVDFSSDLVFDGRAGRPYSEDDPTGPLGAYGRSKERMERLLGGSAGKHLIVRAAAFFSPHDEFNFAVAVARVLSEGRVFAAAADHIVSPTYVPHLVGATLDLVIDGADGVWHLTNGEPVCWAEFGRMIARACGLDERLIAPVPGAELGWIAPRPRYAALQSRRGALMPSLDVAIGEFAHNWRGRMPLAPVVDLPAPPLLPCLPREQCSIAQGARDVAG